jgi:hypothetical protein
VRHTEEERHGMSDETATMTDEVTDLLQRLIRNACVNDGTAESGGEVRNADLLESYLSGCGADIETFRRRAGPSLPRRPARGQRPHRAHPAAHGPTPTSCP